jgi:isoleucyl-tRNA synthetase
VFYSKATNAALMTPETLAHIESVFKAKGSDAWWELDTADLLPPSLRDQADEYTKGTDTMDVWFDSGSSWAGVMQARDELSFPADVYLEGSDQHRGWFQSSLLTSVASQGVAPYKTVITHGFVLDEKGYKMSKSLGNVVDPLTIIEGGSNQKTNPAYGADTLRLFISSVDYSGDVCIGENVIKQQSEGYRKLRNTLRYLVGSLNDFNPATDAVPYEQLYSIDKYILGRLTETVSEIEAAYNEYSFFRVNQALFHLSNADLSSFYLDIAKDRLYISSKTDIRRRSCQTVLHRILEQFAVVMAPIVPHMAEDVWQNIPYAKPTTSVFEMGWPKSADMFPSHEEAFWSKVRLIRNDVNKCIETARQDKKAGASQECQVFLHSDDADLSKALAAITGDRELQAIPSASNGVDDLRFVFLTSRVTVESSAEDILSKCPEYRVAGATSESGVTVGVIKAEGKKCDRCWYYSDSVGDDHDHPDVCPRCADAVKTDGYVV